MVQPITGSEKNRVIDGRNSLFFETDTVPAEAIGLSSNKSGLQIGK